MKKLLSAVFVVLSFCSINAFAKTESFEYFIVNDMSEDLALTLEVCSIKVPGTPICRDITKRITPKAHVAETEALVDGRFVVVSVIKAETSSKRVSTWKRHPGIGGAPICGVDQTLHTGHVINFKGLMDDKITCYKSTM